MIGSHFNITHTDSGALQWARNHYQVRTILDLGCGPGGQVTLAREMGFQATGVDGDPTVTPDICHDFTKGPLHHEKLLPQYDLCWCIEFVEHIDRKYMENFLQLMHRCYMIILTHALPPNNPPSHVNCQPSEYWISILNYEDFDFNYGDSLSIKNASTMGREFIANTGKVFFNRRPFD